MRFHYWHKGRVKNVSGRFICWKSESGRWFAVIDTMMRIRRIPQDKLTLKTVKKLPSHD